MHSELYPEAVIMREFIIYRSRLRAINLTFERGGRVARKSLTIEYRPKIVAQENFGNLPKVKYVLNCKLTYLDMKKTANRRVGYFQDIDLNSEFNQYNFFSKIVDSR